MLILTNYNDYYYSFLRAIAQAIVEIIDINDQRLDDCILRK
jgi:hypothetical protein